MEGNIFGSVLDLDALLGDGDSAFGLEMDGLDVLEGIGDLPTDFPCKASSDDSHLTGMGYEASNDEEDQFAKASSSAQVWGLQGSSPAPFKQTTEGNPDTAALLTQLLSVIQRNAPPKTDPTPCNPPQQMNANPSGLVPSSTGNLTLPNLTAQQQQTLSTIMSIGTVGTTPEGKKVRRMLSNRESARRSRHRKQAHMHNLEEKVQAVEAENNCLKLTLAKASEMELQHTAERLQLQAEVAMLRAKIAQMEHAGSCGTGMKSALHCSHTNTKAESLSFGSCCASIPNQSHLEFEHSSKKRRLTTNQASPV